MRFFIIFTAILLSTSQPALSAKKWDWNPDGNISQNKPINKKITKYSPTQTPSKAIHPKNIKATDPLTEKKSTNDPMSEMLKMYEQLNASTSQPQTATETMPTNANLSVLKAKLKALEVEQETLRQNILNATQKKDNTFFENDTTSIPIEDINAIMDRLNTLDVEIKTLQKNIETETIRTEMLAKYGTAKSPNSYNDYQDNNETTSDILSSLNNFESADTNKDGYIDKNEYIQNSNATLLDFSAYDKNNNSLLSRAEFSKLFSLPNYNDNLYISKKNAEQLSIHEKDVLNYFDVYDLDKDDYLDKTEFMHFYKSYTAKSIHKRFDFFDINKDGKLSPQELSSNEDNFLDTVAKKYEAVFAQ